MKMKKLLALMLVGAMSLSILTACGEEEVAEDVAVEEDVVEDDADVEDDVVEDDADVEVEEDVEEEASTLEVPTYIANATGVDIYEINLSVSGDENWGENLIPEGYMLPAGSIMSDIILEITSEEGVLWDLRVADQDGNSIEWQGLDISEMPTDGFAIELFYDGENATAGLAATPDDLEGEYEGL